MSSKMLDTPLDKNKIFKQIYKLISGTSHCGYIEAVYYSFDAIEKTFTINDGTPATFNLSEGLIYETLKEIIDRICIEDNLVDQDLVDQLQERIDEISLMEEEYVGDLSGVPIQFIPTSKNIVVLSDVQFETEVTSPELINAIAHVHLKRRRDPDFKDEERLAKENYKIFSERLANMEPKADNQMFIIASKKVGDNLLQIFCDCDKLNFFVCLNNGEEIFKSTKRSYFNPSTITKISWDYVRLSK